MATTPDVVKQLVERFGRNLAAYKSPQYNETELRVEFVNPFWSALGWDMENKAGYAMAYRDVIHEDAAAQSQAEALMAQQSDAAIRSIYARYRHDALIKWKDSIKIVVGLRRPAVAGLDK